MAHLLPSNANNCLDSRAVQGATVHVRLSPCACLLLRYVHLHTWPLAALVLWWILASECTLKTARLVGIHSWHRAGLLVLDGPGALHQRRLQDCCSSLASCSACCCGRSSGLASLDVRVGVQGGGEYAGCACPLAQGVGILQRLNPTHTESQS